MVVFPVYGARQSLSLQPLEPAGAFARLLDECVAIPESLTLADAAELVRAVERWRAYELRYDDLDEAATAVIKLCRG